MRVLTGIQPTGTLHLGNYFGAVQPLVQLQATHECFLFVANLHALTIPQDPKALAKHTLSIVGDYMALGINPAACTIFAHSQIPAHAELAWILDTLTPLGELNRMTQFKEKSAGQRDAENAGLYTYPVLMAADILLYQADTVPVGEDQLQHLELARTIARKFNSRFGKTFKEPGAQLPKLGARLMALNDPTKKMSKSLGPDSYIGIFDDPKEIERKIQRAVTDSGRDIVYEPRRKPAIANLLTIHSLVTGTKVSTLEKHFKGKGYAEFKTTLIRDIYEFLSPFQAERRKISESKIRSVLEQGRKKAERIASKTLNDAKKKTGLI